MMEYHSDLLHGFASDKNGCEGKILCEYMVTGEKSYGLFKKCVKNHIISNGRMISCEHLHYDGC